MVWKRLSRYEKLFRFKFYFHYVHGNGIKNNTQRRWYKDFDYVTIIYAAIYNDVEVSMRKDNNTTWLKSLWRKREKKLPRPFDYGSEPYNMEIIFLLVWIEVKSVFSTSYKFRSICWIEWVNSWFLGSCYRPSSRFLTVTNDKQLKWIVQRIEMFLIPILNRFFECSSPPSSFATLCNNIERQT